MSNRQDLFILLSSIINEHRKDAKASTMKRFVEAIEANPTYRDAAISMVFGLLYSRARDSIFPPTTAELTARAQRQARAAMQETEDADRLKATAKTIIAKRLMDFVTPNGKHFGDCTGPECQALGGFYAYVGKEVGENTVRKKFSEATIQAMATKYKILPENNQSATAASTQPSHPPV